jgi:hypothetical protein
MNRQIFKMIAVVFGAPFISAGIAAALMQLLTA